MQAWTPDYPAYLSDLRNIDPTPGCSCITDLGGNSINDIEFDENSFLHESYLGAVVQRDLEANNHPYHQHVYAFQLISGFNDNTGYKRIGDWHDTINGNGSIRFQPSVFTGKLMVHCHRLIHEDRGMMAIEYIHESNTNPCTCVEEYTFPTWAIILIAVGSSTIIISIGGVFFYRRRKKSRPTE